MPSRLISSQGANDGLDRHECREVADPVFDRAQNIEGSLDRVVLADDPELETRWQAAIAIPVTDDPPHAAARLTG
jgi:hypothetical protein